MRLLRPQQLFPMGDLRRLPCSFWHLPHRPRRIGHQVQTRLKHRSHNRVFIRGTRLRLEAREQFYLGVCWEEGEGECGYFCGVDDIYYDCAFL